MIPLYRPFQGVYIDGIVRYCLMSVIVLLMSLVLVILAHSLSQTLRSVKCHCASSFPQVFPQFPQVFPQPCGKL